MQSSQELAAKLENQSTSLEQSVLISEEKVRKNEELVARMQDQLRLIDEENKLLQKRIMAELLAQTGVSSVLALEGIFTMLEKRKTQFLKRTNEIRRETEKVKSEVLVVENDRQRTRNLVTETVENERQGRLQLEQKLRNNLKRLASSN